MYKEAKAALSVLPLEVARCKHQPLHAASTHAKGPRVPEPDPVAREMLRGGFCVSLP